MADPTLIQQMSSPDGISDFERGMTTAPFRVAQAKPSSRATESAQKQAQTSQVNITILKNTWEKGFSNLTDEELNKAYNEIRLNSLEQYEKTELHDFFVYTIINLAIEKAKRDSPGRTIRQIVSDAWEHKVQIPLRENSTKPDRLLTIYRDAERFLELANTTLGSSLGGISQFAAQPLFYDPAKAVAWWMHDEFGSDKLLRLFRTTEDYPSRPGGVEWAFMGANYGFLNLGAPKPFLVALPHYLLREAELEASRQQKQQHPPKPTQFRQVRIYPIQEDDTLWNLAYRFYGDGRQWEKLWEANKGTLRSGNPNLIFPGERIEIP